MKDAPVLLHLGCGIVAPKGWINIDNSWNAYLHKFPLIISFLKSAHLVPGRYLDIPWPKNILRFDIRKRLPFLDNSVDGIYSADVLEHLTKSEGINLIRECYRVLKHDKSVRFIVPDLVECVKDCRDADTLLASLQICPDYDASSLAERIYFLFYQPYIHKWMYDKKSLSLRLKNAGFTHIRLCGLYESRIPKIRLVERRKRLLKYSFCIEAEKA